MCALLAYPMKKNYKKMSKFMTLSYNSLSSLIFSRCTNDFVGEFCEYPNPCHTGGQICQNGGTCSVMLSGNQGPRFQCHCPIGYTQSFCEVAVSENACRNDPCKNGGTCTLVSNLSNYTCSCPIGLKGESEILVKSHTFNA